MILQFLKNMCSRLFKAVISLFTDKITVIQKGDHSNNINISGDISIQQNYTYNNKGDVNAQQGNNNTIKR